MDVTEDSESVAHPLLDEELPKDRTLGMSNSPVEQRDVTFFMGETNEYKRIDEIPRPKGLGELGSVEYDAFCEILSSLEGDFDSCMTSRYINAGGELEELAEIRTRRFHRAQERFDARGEVTKLEKERQLSLLQKEAEQYRAALYEKTIIALQLAYQETANQLYSLDPSIIRQIDLSIMPTSDRQGANLRTRRQEQSRPAANFCTDISDDIEMLRKAQEKQFKDK